ncbi:MAG TPA: MMPL family transporter [Xanthobacteraceae bacterium]|nr:MMPL family transporter [Xanthobacteraceae bacterium]
MLNSVLARVTSFCVTHATIVILFAAAISAGAGVYAARRFAIDTNLNNLISSELPWRQRELAYEAAFPQSTQSILAVIDAPTPELASAGADALAHALSGETDRFRSVTQPGGGEFFERNMLLYLSESELRDTTDRLKSAAPLIRSLAADPSLRGLTTTLAAALQGVRAERYSIEQMGRVFDAFSDTIEDGLAGRPASFSWKVLLSGRPASENDRRRLIQIWANLDYAALVPGQKAATAIRTAAADTKLGSDFAASLRLTGPVPIADAEFASLREGTTLNAVISIVAVLVILWLALGSARLVLAVAITLAAGLATAGGIAFLLVGALNPISVAFAVLFVGLGADFAIQYSVRYRERRHDLGSLQEGIVAAARWIGAPLLLAALSAAAGFFSFMPTDYRGLAELGLISGCGMVVAYLACMTLLPAIIRLLRPPHEPRPLGFSRMAPVDRFLARHRLAVVVTTGVIALAGSPLLLALRFDFNPLHLRNLNDEAVATYLQLSKDPSWAGNPAEVLTQSPDEAAAVAARLSALPEVARTMTIDSFVPSNQPAKLQLISAAAASLDQALNPAMRRPAPSNDENATALRETAQQLEQGAGSAAAAKRLADNMMRLADASQAVRATVQAALIRPLEWNLDQLRRALHPETITRENLPQDLVQDWISANGQHRVEALPRGDQDDNDNLRRFANAVLRVEPNATGPAIGISEWASTMINAFIEAGALALVAIALLLWVVLRRIGDVLLTLIPLLVAALVTLEVCGLAQFPLNYANMMALPVLLGVGVAFKIYYVTAWRAGETNFLQSVLTRAVVCSALMTATAFGTLWISSNPGISSMGKLLVLSLACTLASAALFQPALMGAPREGKPP